MNRIYSFREEINSFVEKDNSSIEDDLSMGLQLLNDISNLSSGLDPSKRRQLLNQSKILQLTLKKMATEKKDLSYLDNNNNSNKEEQSAWIAQEDSIREEITNRLQSMELVRRSAEELNSVENSLKKQELLVKCRVEQDYLKKAAMNIKDVGAKLDIVIGFLSDFQSQLSSMDLKLDNIQADISIIKNDLKSLIIRSPIEIIEEWSKRTLTIMYNSLPNKVYIESEVCDAGPNNDFLPLDGELNPKQLIVSKVFKEFLEDKKKNILLLSGMAGSGKSTAIEEMKKYVLNDYTDKRKKSCNRQVILLPVSLPTLKDPIGGIFKEGAKLAYDGSLSDNQVQILLNEIQSEKSKIDIIFILDAYDELRPDLLMKNLWRSNNLEQYRSKNISKEKEVCEEENESFPKVIITSRSELFSDKKNYLSTFLPMEQYGVTKNTEELAKEYLREVRFISFQDRREDYQRQYTAIMWRNYFLNKILGKTLLTNYLPYRTISDKIAFKKQFKKILDSFADQLRRSMGRQSQTKEDEFQKKLNSFTDQLFDIYIVSTLPLNITSDNNDNNNNLGAKFDKAFEILKNKFSVIKAVDNDIDQILKTSLLSLLVVLFNVDIERTNSSLVNSLLSIYQSASEENDIDLWLLAKYNKEFEKTPELIELTSTPFMIEVVTEILSMQNKKRTENDYKSELIRVLGNDIADVLWTKLKLNSGENKEKRDYCLNLNIIENIRFAFDKPSDDEEYIFYRNLIYEFSQDSVSDILTKIKETSDKGEETDAPQYLLSSQSDKKETNKLSSIIDRCVFSVFKRPVLRRSSIYSNFIELCFSREIKKSILSRNTLFEPETLRYEGYEYSRQLSFYLTKKGLTKLKKMIHSKLFIDSKHETDIFFSDTPLAIAVRKIAPIRESGGFVSFVHKTIQEYLVADLIISSIRDSVDRTNYSTSDLETLLDIMLKEQKMTETIKTTEVRRNSIIINEMKKREVNDKNQHLKILSNRQKQELLQLFIIDICQSPLASIDLTGEIAVFDFIVDYLISSPTCLFDVKLVYKLSQNIEFIIMNFTNVNKLLLEQIQSNLKLLVKVSFPRRGNKTILHESAAEGMIELIDFIRELVGNNINELVDKQDNKKKTAFFLAAESGQSETIDCLLSDSWKANFEIAAIISPSKQILIKGKYNDNSYQLIGYPMVKIDEVTQTCFGYEVEIMISEKNKACVQLGWSLNRKYRNGNECILLCIDNSDWGDGVFVEYRNEKIVTKIKLNLQVGIIRIGMVADVSKKQFYFYYFGEKTEKKWIEVPSSRDHPQKSILVELENCFLKKNFFPIIYSFDISEITKINLGNLGRFIFTSLENDDNKTTIEPVSSACVISPMLLAAKGGHMRVCELIIKYVINDDKNIEKILSLVYEDTGESLLHFFIKYGATSLIDLLHESTSNIMRLKEILSRNNYNGVPPLFYIKNNKMLKYLCDKRDVDINIKDSNGNTLLLSKSQNGHLEVVKCLLNERDVDINAINKNTRTALMLASTDGHFDVVKFLCEKKNIDFNTKDEYGYSALMLASKEGNLEIVEYLCDINGVDINAKDDCGRTALILASKGGHLEVVKILCEKDVDLNAKSNDGYTALMEAGGHLEVVKYLCGIEGVDINAKNSSGKTALMLASSNGRVEVVKVLFEIGGVDINMKSNDGKTALMFASEGGKLEIVKILCGIKDIDINAKSNDGKTALMFASLNEHLEVVKYLCGIGGVDVNMKSNDGYTALMFASLNGRLKAVKILCEIKDIDINAKNKYGKTALMLACTQGHFDVVKFLCEIGGVDINAKNEDGKTALMFASTEGRLEVVKYLCGIEGIDINAKDEDGKTALMIASEGRDLDIIEFLFEKIKMEKQV